MSTNFINLVFHRIKNHFSKPKIPVKIYPDKYYDDKRDKIKKNYTNIVIETKLYSILETEESIK